MSNYTVIVNYAAKDSLTTGDPSKKIKGTEISAELSAISTAVNSKEDSANKGQASGYCGLNGSSEVPDAQIPSNIPRTDAASNTFSGNVSVTGTLQMGGATVWTTGNDGSGSGLDADTLDGQHGAYYLPAASYTAADILSKLLTVDGASSGIDADKLDGQEGSYYQPASTLLASILAVDGSGSGIDADKLDGAEGSAYALLAGAQFTGFAATTPSAVTFSATAMTLNCALSNVFTTTFTANVTTAPTVSNPKDGQTINWFITQDGTGSRTMTWPTSFKWPNGTAGVLSTAASSVDLLTATYRSATTSWYCTLLKAFS